MTMERWTREHTLAAVRQGWCISEVLCGDNHAPWEVQRLDDAESASEDYGVKVPQLASDDEAVQVLREAWQRGEPHAVLAYQLLRENSPQEFAYWRMEVWQKTG
jgi:hypothetical protein